VIYFRRAYGTRIVSSINPPLKWRAIVKDPSGILKKLPWSLAAAPL